MEIGKRCDRIDQIAEFIGEYIGNNPGYSPLVLAETVRARFLISPDEAGKLVTCVQNELSLSKLFLAAIELNLTFNCNLACDYCFVRRKSAHERMDFDTAKKAIDLLLARAAVPVVTITLIGGEPLLELGLIRKILPYATAAARRRSLQINWAITTNGTLIDEEALQLFARYRVNMLLSIDGGPESHDRHRRTKSGAGSWRQIVAALPLIKKFQPHLEARVTVAPDALDAMRDNIIQLVGLGFERFIIAPAHGPKMWSKKEIVQYARNLVAIIHDYHELKLQGAPLFIEEFERREFERDEACAAWGCQAGVTSLAVAPNGEISPCSKLLGLEDAAGRCIIGNVNEGFDASLLEPFRNAITRQPRYCRRCPEKCHGGCYAVNFEQTGDHFIPSEENCLFWTVRQETRRISGRLARQRPLQQSRVSSQ
jgi:uncharacterized protein